MVKYHENHTNTNNLVRSGSNGWHYSREVVIPEEAKDEAIKASRALGMDFCAVDMLYDSKTRVTTILEANSAPELGPWTSKAYAKEFIKLTT